MFVSEDMMDERELFSAPPKVFPAGDSSWQVEIQPVKVALPSNEKLYYVVQFNRSRQSCDDFKTV